ncbi:MAG: PAS domain-containing sensor histidine kinase [Bacteroidales bacterium]
MINDPWVSSLLHSVSTGICILSRDGRVLFWNDFMESYLDIPEQTILGRPIRDFFPAFGQERYKDRIDRVFDFGAPAFFSARLHSLFRADPDTGRDAELFQDLTISFLEGKGGGEGYALLSVHDVTDLNHKLEERNRLYRRAREEILEREKAETRLRESETRLTELNRTKDQLMSIIAHDLRGPISSNVLGLESLIGSYGDMGEEEKLEFLKLMLEGSNQTLSLLEDLLVWARVQSGVIAPRIERFSMDQLASREHQTFFQSATQKEIGLHLDLGSHLEVDADKNMILAVLRNLISNAIKFTPRGGQVWVKATRHGRTVRVEVKDTGVGMDPTTLSQLLEAGKLVTTPGTEQEKGTGFGLKLCQEFLQKNGGALEIVSQPGNGSSFSFTLPSPPTS